MGWYDWFAHFYDGSMEKLYREQRQLATSKLALNAGDRVLECPVGTGLSLDEMVPAVGATGAIVGVDVSKGMLKRAARRCAERGYDNVALVQAGVHQLPDALATGDSAGGAFDRLHVFLGLSAFPEWERAFEVLWQQLKPGGRCVVVDVHDAEPGFQGKMVNLVARADIRRCTWTGLEEVAVDYHREPLPSLKQHGGELYVAWGDKPLE